MKDLEQDKLILIQYCDKLGIDLKISDEIIKTFHRMWWKVDDEIHAFSFTSYLFLIDKFNLPIFYVSAYPESTIKAIKTFIVSDSDEDLFDILLREYKYINNGNDLAELLAHYTLVVLNLWKININPKII